LRDESICAHLAAFEGIVVPLERLLRQTTAVHLPMPLPPRQIPSRTRSGRLAALDAYLVRYERDLLARANGTVVIDVGFGEHPWTTLEMAEAFRQLDPSLVVVGLETDEARIERAQAMSAEGLVFMAVTEDLPSRLPAPARLVRAMNVLRGYAEAEVDAAHETWGSWLTPGGLLIEGTSDPEGSIVTCHLLRKNETTLEHEGLLLYTDFRRGFAPWMFRDWLPRDLRRGVREGTEIHAFFAEWTEHWNRVREAGTRDPREAFAKSLLSLAMARPDINADPALVSEGYVMKTTRKSGG
jgi:hypothetical protein